MRRRINRTLLTATAASASVITLGFMATGAVGASTTTAGLASGASSITPISPPGKATDCTPPGNATTPSTCAVAGYQASGRLFRYAQAFIVVPNHPAATVGVPGSSPQVEPDAAIYVALDDSAFSNDFTRVGIVACPAVTFSSSAAVAGAWPCPGTAAGGPSVVAGWYVFTTRVQTDGATTVVDHALNASQDGLGIFVSVYLSPTGNSVHTVIQTPTTTGAGVNGGAATTGVTYNDTFPVSGPTYTNADAVADWTSVAGTTTAAPYQPAAGVAGSGVPGTVAYTQFKDGRFTTWNGTKGTFDGKWTLNSFEATVDGTSATSVVTSPGYLWSSTPGYANDSFGVWLRAL